VEKINSEEASVLLDIIKLIDYNIDSIIDKIKTKKSIIKFYKNSIMTTLKSLEKNRNFEFLYLCILLIISRMRDDIDNFNENLIRMASNKSIGNTTGILNAQGSTTQNKASDLIKAKTNNLINDSNANDYYFNSNILTTRNLNPVIPGKLYNLNNLNNKIHKDFNANKHLQQQDIHQASNSLNNKTENDRAIMNENRECRRSKEKQSSNHSFTNNQTQNSNATNDLNIKTDISWRSSLMAYNNNKNNNNSGSNSNLINGYVNVNRISPNINSTLNQVVNGNKNTDIIEASNNISNTAVNNDEKNRNREKYLTINEYFENNESRKSSRHYNSLADKNANENNNKTEKIILGKNQIKNFTHDLNDNVNSLQISNLPQKNNNKEKDLDIANHFSKKLSLNKKNKNISLLNLRKGKGKDIDRESIFSIRNDYSKSPIMHPSYSSSKYNLLGNLIIIAYLFILLNLISSKIKTMMSTKKT